MTIRTQRTPPSLRRAVYPLLLGLCVLLGAAYVQQPKREGQDVWRMGFDGVDSLRRVVARATKAGDEATLLKAKALLSWQLIRDESPYRQDSQGASLALEVIASPLIAQQPLAKLYAARTLAMIYRRKGDLYNEVLYSRMVADLGPQWMSDSVYAMFVNYEYAFTLYRLNLFDEIIPLERRAAQFFRATQQPEHEAGVYSHLGNVYDRLNQHDSARAYFNRSYALYVRYPIITSGVGKANVRVNQAELFIEEGQIDSAMAYLNEGLSFLPAGTAAAGVRSDILSNLALTYLKKQQPQRALALAEQALVYARQVPEDLAGRRDAYDLLYRSCIALGRPAEALAHYRDFIQLEQQLSASADRLAIAERDYQIRLSEQQTRLVERESALEASDTQRKTLIWGTGIGLVMLLALAYSHRITRLKNRRLNTQNSQIEQQKIALEASQRQLIDSNDELKRALEQLERTQDQLILNEKRSALGQLVANIAHELNSPVGTISAATQQSQHLSTALLSQLPRALDVLQGDDKARYLQLLDECLGDVHQLSTREERQRRTELIELLKAWNSPEELRPLAENLVRLRPSAPAAELLEVTTWLRQHPQRDMLIDSAADAAPRPTDVVASIETVLLIYHNALSRGVSVEGIYPSRPVLDLQVESIELVWSHLIRNAIQAMPPPDGGRITIRLDTTPEGYEFHFSDTGAGIAPEVLPKIFEPFFTTRPLGQGSGLGLYLVRRIVAQYDGRVSVASGAGGSTFTVFLPAALAGHDQQTS